MPRPPKSVDRTPEPLLADTFARLVSAIAAAHQEMAGQAGRAVNRALTLRNWLIGCYIERYERAGVDRAEYGERLMDELARSLQQRGLARCDRRELYRYRQFFLAYPQIVESLPPAFDAKALAPTVETVSPHSMPARQLIESLSFSHLAELIQIGDAAQRAFYERECVRGNWSVRELKRQIASLYFERSALSTRQDVLATQTHSQAEAPPPFPIRDPYVFEFLGLEPREVMGESALEDQLLDKLQGFLLELGHGFCFEARQKRILIGDSHYFIDLVFYHRILKCHVLVELKVAEFNHENIGQLNTYVSWYRQHMASPGDNPPVGILLCTQKDHALAEYALAGLDNRLFVSQYLLELPKKEAMQEFIERQLAELKPSR
jgi:predicted nuclease of restriction endonuclease-like (RecB) superfamily